MSGLLTGCWYFEDCPDNVGGIKTGQRLETTIVSRLAKPGAAATCGDLGDLPPGARVTWLASLEGSAETCEDEVDVDARSLSSAELSLPDFQGGTASITLPGGCSGDWSLQIEALKSDAPLLGPVDATDPQWVLRRTFRASPAAAACPSEVLSPSGCNDRFIAETRVLEPE